MYKVDTYNNFQDDQGNNLQIGELEYISKKGKQALSFVDNVPARDVKSALSLVIRLLLEHLNFPEGKSSIVDLLMIEIKKSSKDKTGFMPILLGRSMPVLQNLLLTFF